MNEETERDVDPHTRQGLIIGAILLVIILATAAMWLWQRNAEKPIPQTTPTKTLLTDCTGWIVSLEAAAQSDYSPVLVTGDGNGHAALLVCRTRPQAERFTVTLTPAGAERPPLEVDLRTEDTEPLGMMAGNRLPEIPPGEWTVTYRVDGEVVAQTWFVVIPQG